MDGTWKHFIKARPMKTLAHPETQPLSVVVTGIFRDIKALSSLSWTKVYVDCASASIETACRYSS